MPGVNYREHFKTQLAELRQKKAELDSEMERISSALGCLDEADRNTLQGKLFSPAGNGIASPKAKPGTADAVVACLKLSGKMMKRAAIREYLSNEREVTNGAINAALTRLRGKKAVFRRRQLWGLVGQDYTTTSDGVQ